MRIDLSQDVDLGSDAVCVLVHAQLLIETERGRSRTRTRLREELRFRD